VSFESNNNIGVYF